MCLLGTNLAVSYNERKVVYKIDDIDLILPQNWQMAKNFPNVKFYFRCIKVQVKVHTDKQQHESMLLITAEKAYVSP